MREVDGWDEAVDLIDEDDIKRWNADKKLCKHSNVKLGGSVQ